MTTTMMDDQTIQLVGDSPWLTRVAELGPEFLREERERARKIFAGAGLPTIRDEEFKYTNFDALRNKSFRPGEAVTAEVTAEEFEAVNIPGLVAATLVFVNGRYSEEHSSLDGLPNEITIRRLSEAWREIPELVEPHLARSLDIEADPFAALNTAAFEDGLFVYVPKGVQVETPIHVLNITSAIGEPLLTNPRNLIIAEPESRLVVIEDYVALRDNDVYLNNAVTEIVVDENAEVEHYYLERESERGYNVATLRVVQQRDSRFTSHSALFGGAIVRNNVLPKLAGENCFSVLNGLYTGRREQHLDNFMRVEHAKPHGDSRQYYKGVLDDKARGVFSGRIIVAPGAQKTDAKQSNQNLLLSDDARANTKPQLEIYADDVKCTHGATIGELDDEAIFYLRARGLNETEARSLLIHAFAAECLERMTVEPVREYLDHLLTKRLPKSAALEAATGAG